MTSKEWTPGEFERKNLATPQRGGGGKKKKNKQGEPKGADSVLHRKGGKTATARRRTPGQ